MSFVHSLACPESTAVLAAQQMLALPCTRPLKGMTIGQQKASCPSRAKTSSQNDSPFPNL